MIAEDADMLRRVAEAADEEGRPWEWQGGYPQKVIRVGDVVVVADCFESPDAPSRFAEFIATFDPPTVLKLLTLREGLRDLLSPRRAHMQRDAIREHLRALLEDAR